MIKVLVVQLMCNSDDDHLCSKFFPCTYVRKLDKFMSSKLHD